MALPKFYTQVLHLMNKMNLPPPFEENAIPGVFSRDRELERVGQRERQQTGFQSLKRKFPGAQPSSFTVEEEDDDDDDDGEDGSSTNRDDSVSSSGDAAKKPRVEPQPQLPADHPMAASSSNQPPPQRVPPVATATSHPKPLSAMIARAFETSGLGAAQSRSPRVDLLSEQELAARRLPADGSF